VVIGTPEYVNRGMKLLRVSRLWQPPALALKGLDAIHLGGVYHPGPIEPFGLDGPISQQSV
jgi:hypothetical protein